MHNSGKLLILAMLAVGVLAAGSSWWFRFSATHDAVRFWGPATTRLIRDAPTVDLVQLEPPSSDPSANEAQHAREAIQFAARHNVSQAHGMTHLRHALIEDRSFQAFDIEAPPEWAWAIEFRDGAESATILFSADCTVTTLHDTGDRRAASCTPIAAGLREIFAEFTTEPARSH